MKHTMLRWICLLLVAATLLTGCAVAAPITAEADPANLSVQLGKSKKNTQPTEETRAPITEDGQYSSKEDVAEYLHLFGHLPDNYLTKSEAQDLGWVASRGNLWKVAPGMSIGGDRFGNREGLLPTKKGRKYYECDIDFDGTYRNAKRIVFSNDGLIYYTEDHYESFELLYGEES